jgi:putative membrane protein
MNFLLRIIITAVVAFALSYVLPGIHIDSFWTAIVLSLVLAILNLLLKPLLIILTLPITILTFGLFLFIINALIVWLARDLVDGFHVKNFGWALLFSLLLSLLTSLLYKDQDRDRERDRDPDR